MVLFPDSSAHSENFGDVEVVDRTGEDQWVRGRVALHKFFSVQIFMEKSQGPAHLKAEVSIECFFPMFQGS